MIRISDNVTVSFCYHENGIIKAVPGKTDVAALITTGGDCLIGMNDVLMPGIMINDHCIVDAGSGCPQLSTAYSAGGQSGRAHLHHRGIRGGIPGLRGRSEPKGFFTTHPEYFVQRN